MASQSTSSAGDRMKGISAQVLLIMGLCRYRHTKSYLKRTPITLNAIKSSNDKRSDWLRGVFDHVLLDDHCSQNPLC